MKFAHIIGARPQFIKYFPIAKALEGFYTNAGHSSQGILIHTGQHYDYSMSKIFFDQFEIKAPDYHLEIGSGSHGKQTGQIIQKAEEVLKQEKPDAVLVYGDTNSTLGGALATAKLKIPVIHIEAGLRSFQKEMPEEINRILTDHVSTLLFCPSYSAVRNLIGEGIKNNLNNGKLISLKPLAKDLNVSQVRVDSNSPLVVNVGDVMYDVLLYSMELAQKNSKILEELNLRKKDYYLLTVHREKNTLNKESLQETLNFVEENSKGKTVIFPMHPRTKQLCQNINIRFSSNIKIIEPLGYFDILMLLKNSKALMTDSGGMQKEAYWLKVPCITLREETEWIETVQSGWNILSQNYKGSHEPKDSECKSYGDGKTGERIVHTLINYLRG